MVWRHTIALRLCFQVFQEEILCLKSKTSISTTYRLLDLFDTRTHIGMFVPLSCRPLSRLLNSELQQTAVQAPSIGTPPIQTNVVPPSFLLVYKSKYCPPSSTLCAIIGRSSQERGKNWRLSEASCIHWRHWGKNLPRSLANET